jgi:hypothetical protein
MAEDGKKAMRRKTLGERIGPKWAFWGIGLLGLYPLFASIAGIIAVKGQLAGI